MVIDEYVSSVSVLEPHQGRRVRLVWLVIGLLLAVLLFVILVFYVLFDSARVEGDSMSPALHDEDRILTTKGYERPSRGDVVSVEAVIDGEPDRLLKRVIAIPGDTVRVDEDVATVNGVTEDATRLRIIPGRGDDISEGTMPEGHVWVMGDNRVVSLDSRAIGMMPLSSVTSKAVYIFWPPNRIGKVR